MPIVNLFSHRKSAERARNAAHDALLGSASIEVMPRTAAKVPDLRALLPAGTRVYVAHIEGTTTEEMAATTRRLSDEGFRAMPHVPARLVADRADLEDRLRRYRAAGASEALILAGGAAKPAGAFSDSMQLLETGLFDRLGFTRLHVAGHPEGNRDIDPRGGDANVDAALAWKQAFADRTDADMAIVTQFAFDAAPVIRWADRIRAAGATLPVHVGLAGPAKLQTLLKFAIACGVGPSVSVLQKRARDVTKPVTPYEPSAVLDALSERVARHGESPIAGIHFFPLGGIARCAEYAWPRQDASASKGSATV
jgi:methylenetetrahydrofolate reductase (NADPH)